MSSLIQRSFAGGEIAPALYGRADQTRYQSGARTVLNWLIRREGAATNRAGFQFITEVKDSTKPPVFFKFVFNSDQTYLIEVGDLYMRFVSNAAQVTVSTDEAEWSVYDSDPADTVDTITNAANNGGGLIRITTSAAHGLNTSDWVNIAGVLGTTEANGRHQITVISATVFDIYTTPFVNAYVSGGTVTREGMWILNAVDSGTGEIRITTNINHGLVSGDRVRVSGVTGTTEANGQWPVTKISNTVVDLDGSVFANAYGFPEMGAIIREVVRTYTTGDIVPYLGTLYVAIADSTGLAAPPDSAPLAWYPLTDDIYEIATPYAQEDLLGLRYAQSADVITIVHPDYPPMELRRYGAADWRLVEVSTVPSTNSPTSVAATAGVAPSTAIATPTGLAATGAAGGTQKSYKVTAWRVGPNAESEASAEALSNIGNSTYPIVVTWNSVAAANGYGLYKYDAGSSRWALIATINSGTLTYTDAGQTPAVPLRTAPTGGTNSTTYEYVVTAIDDTTGAESLASSSGSCDGQTPTTVNPNVVTWGAVVGASKYNVYRKKNGLYGYIGQASGTSFNDDNIEPSSTQPPISNPPFASTDNYPSTVAYFQQRLFSGGTNNNPEKFWATAIGDYHSYVSSTPIEDDDALSFTIADGQVNAIRALIPLRKMVILTKGGEHVLGGNADGAITTLSPNLTQQGTRGAAEMKPLVIGDTAIYIQAQGTIVRDLRYDYQSDGYTGKDLTVFATHIFYGHTIVDWDYAENPHSIVWGARDDGTLLGLTYIREQEMVAWHRQTTGDGDSFERVCTVPEGDENAVYCLIRRTVDGNEVRYIERMHSRQVTDVAVDAFFVDSGLTYDGRNTEGTTFTIAASGGIWDLETGTFFLSASAQTFAGDSSDIGKVFEVTYGDDRIRCTVVNYGNVTQVTVGLSELPPQWLRDGNSVTTWAVMATEFSGLEHLEGRTVAALGDGNDLGTYVVSSGAIALSVPCSIVHVGLPITADLETLDLETPNAETISNKQKRINNVTLLLEDTRGIKAGSDEDHLEDALLRKLENMDDPLEPYTGKVTFHLRATWDDNGRTLIRQTAPLPATVLAIAASGLVGQG